MKFSTVAVFVAATVASVLAAPASVTKRDVNPALVPDFGVAPGQNPNGSGYVASQVQAAFIF